MYAVQLCVTCVCEIVQVTRVLKEACGTQAVTMSSLTFQGQILL